MQDRKCCPDKDFLSRTKHNVVSAFDQIARHGVYDDLYTSSRCQAEDKFLGELINQYLPEHANVLDLGCGTGLFLRITGWRRQQYRGLDLSSEMIGHAIMRHPTAEFVQGDAENIPWGAKTFDAVVALYGTPSYWTDPMRVLGEIHRVLYPGGRVVLIPYALRWFRKGIGVMGDVNIQTSPAPWMPDQTQRRMIQSGFTDVSLMGFSFAPRVRFIENLASCLFPERGRYMIVLAEKPHDPESARDHRP